MSLNSTFCVHFAEITCMKGNQKIMPTIPWTSGWCHLIHGSILHSRRLSYTAIALRFACCLVQLRSQVHPRLLLVSNGLVTTGPPPPPPKKRGKKETMELHIYCSEVTTCYFHSIARSICCTVSLNPHNGNVINLHSA